MHPATPEPADVTLRATMSLTADELRVAYQLENRGRSVLAVYDGAAGAPPQEPDGWPDLTGQVYVSFQAPSLLHLKRIRPPTPKGKRIARIHIPAASRLEAGAKREVRFALKLPLAEYSQYFPAHSGAQWEERTATRVQLWIGYFRATAETVFKPLPQNPQIFRLGGRFGAQEFVTASQELEVKVRVRTDPVFQRV